MKFINLTPHPIHVYDPASLVEAGKPGSNQWTLREDSEPFLTLPTEVTPITAPRVEVAHELLRHEGEVPVYRAQWGEVYNLPDPQEEVGYIVSALVKQACQARNDLFTVLGAVKDENSRMCGCTGLAC